MGAKRRLNTTSKINRQTDTHTGILTYRNICPEGRCFKINNNCILDQNYSDKGLISWNSSFFLLGWSLTKESVLASQIFGQASAESWEAYEMNTMKNK